jgi:hypothetical protein
VYAPPGGGAVVVVDPAAGLAVLADFDAELEQPAASIPAATSNTPSDLSDTRSPQQSVRRVYEGADWGFAVVDAAAQTCETAAK